VIPQRYFRSSAETYEAVRSGLDAAFGYPDGVTETVWVPASVAPRDSQGRCLLAVRSESCERPQVASVLPQLLASGAVEEIDAETYMAALPVG
jgi:hypothetical protein